MASSVIHMCVAKEVNKYLKRNEKDILIGSIAPDISKQINETKLKSHFLDNEFSNLPNIEKFLNKYKNDFNNDFVMGYYIHLYTDFLWFKYFIPNFIKNDYIYNLKNEKVKLSEEEKTKYIYNDYTNLNVNLIDEYELDLSIFYEEAPDFKNIIEEIPMNKIQIIIDKTGLIIKNSKEFKAFVFDLDIINKFIEFSTSDILSKLETLK